MIESEQPYNGEQDKTYTPKGEWIEVCRRLSSLDQSGNAISDSILLLPDTDPRKIMWMDVVNKILMIREAVEINCESDLNPDTDVYKNLEEAEKKILDFVN